MVGGDCGFIIVKASNPTEAKKRIEAKDGIYLTNYVSMTELISVFRNNSKLIEKINTYIDDYCDDKKINDNAKIHTRFVRELLESIKRDFS